MSELSEKERELSLEVFMTEWSKRYPMPPNFPGVPLWTAIEAVLSEREGKK